jgi:hypothetical protein
MTVSMGKQEKKDVTTFNPPALFANRVFIKPFQTPEPPMADARMKQIRQAALAST